MQTRVLRRKIGECIELLEPGAFQDFCLYFLPRWDKTLTGLERFGGTADGRARKGVPDLLLTRSDGSQIVAMCSTEARYWDECPPERWKPLKDATACASEFRQLEQVLLCSSREIPTTGHNVKQSIIEHCRNKLDIVVRPICRTDFEREICNSVNTYREIIEDFCQELAREFADRERTATAVMALDLYTKDVGHLDTILSEVTSGVRDAGGLVDEAVERRVREAVLRQRRSKFELEWVPFEGIRRHIDWILLGGDPKGRTLCIRGVPKIGKTFLARQLCESIQDCVLDRVWLACNPAIRLQPEEERVLLEDVVSLVAVPRIPAAAIHDHFRSHLTLEQSLKRGNADVEGRKIVILDNCENLSDWFLNRIDCYLRELKNAGLFRDVTVLFLSVTSLAAKVQTIDREEACPAWSESELQELVSSKGASGDLSKPAYWKILALLSHGHPLLAMALAKECPRLDQLTTRLFEAKNKPLYDDSLTERVKRLMYEQLLESEDERTTVGLASHLITSFTPEAIDYIAKNLHIPISLPLPVVVDRLKNSILAWQGGSRYTVERVFREVARFYTQRTYSDKDVFRHMADYLSMPIDGTLDGPNACDGVLYTMASGNIPRALFRAFHILANLTQAKLAPDTLRYYVSELKMITAIEPEPEESVLLAHFSAISALCVSFMNLNERVEVATCIDILDRTVSKYSQLSTPRAVRIELIEYQLASLQVDWACRCEEYDRALEILSELNYVEEVIEDRFGYRLFELVPGLVMKADNPPIPMGFLRDFLGAGLRHGYIDVAQIVSAGLALGSACHNKSISVSDLISRASPTNAGIDLLIKSMLAQSIAQGDTPEDSLVHIDELLALPESTPTIEHSALKAIRVLKADVLYRLGERTRALEFYEAAGTLLSREADRFLSAWCDYRSGLLTADDGKALAKLDSATAVLRTEGNREDGIIALGELAILNWRLGNRQRCVSLLNEIARQYLDEAQEMYGVFAWVALNLLSQVARQDVGLADRESSDGKVWPGMRRGVFAKLARGFQPPGEKITLYWTMAEASSIVGLHKTAYELRKRVCEFPIADSVSCYSYVDAAMKSSSSYEKAGQAHAEGLRRLSETQRFEELADHYGRALLAVWASWGLKTVKLRDHKFWTMIAENAKLLYRCEITPRAKWNSMILILVRIFQEGQEAGLEAARAISLNRLGRDAARLPEPVKHLVFPDKEITEDKSTH